MLHFKVSTNSQHDILANKVAFGVNLGYDKISLDLLRGISTTFFRRSWTRFWPIGLVISLPRVMCWSCGCRLLINLNVQKLDVIVCNAWPSVSRYNSPWIYGTLSINGLRCSKSRECSTSNLRFSSLWTLNPMHSYLIYCASNSKSNILKLIKFKETMALAQGQQTDLPYSRV